MQQDTRLMHGNLLHFFISTMKHQKGNVNKSFLLKCIRQKFRKKPDHVGVKDPYAENYKTLIRETEDDSKKWKDSPCSLDWKNQ